LEYVQESVTKRLAARGYQRTASGNPDLLIHYHVSVTNPIRLGGDSEREGYCCHCEPPFLFWPGTLIIDLIDVQRNRLAWRGWIEEDGMDVSDRDSCAKRIDRMVMQILAKLPRSRPGPG
jgi:hypothetical protein